MDKILSLDFGSQVAQLIARRVREAHVYCELHPFDMSLEDIKAFQPSGIILSAHPAKASASLAAKLLSFPMPMVSGLPFLVPTILPGSFDDITRKA